MITKLKPTGKVKFGRYEFDATEHDGKILIGFQGEGSGHHSDIGLKYRHNWSLNQHRIKRYLNRRYSNQLAYYLKNSGTTTFFTGEGLKTFLHDTKHNIKYDNHFFEHITGNTPVFRAYNDGDFMYKTVSKNYAQIQESVAENVKIDENVKSNLTKLFEEINATTSLKDEVKILKEQNEELKAKIDSYEEAIKIIKERFGIDN